MARHGAATQAGSRAAGDANHGQKLGACGRAEAKRQGEALGRSLPIRKGTITVTWQQVPRTSTTQYSSARPTAMRRSETPIPRCWNLGSRCGASSGIGSSLLAVLPALRACCVGFFFCAADDAMDRWRDGMGSQMRRGHRYCAMVSRFGIALLRGRRHCHGLHPPVAFRLQVPSPRSAQDWGMPPRSAPSLAMRHRPLLPPPVRAARGWNRRWAVARDTPFACSPLSAPARVLFFHPRILAVPRHWPRLAGQFCNGNPTDCNATPWRHVAVSGGEGRV